MDATSTGGGTMFGGAPCIHGGKPSIFCMRRSHGYSEVMACIQICI